MDNPPPASYRAAAWVQRFVGPNTLPTMTTGTASQLLTSRGPAPTGLPRTGSPTIGPLGRGRAPARRRRSSSLPWVSRWTALFLGLVAWLSLSGRVSAGAQQQAGDEPTETLGIVVPVKGELSIVTTALVQRALRAADGSGISHVVLVIDSEGGLIQLMGEIEALLASIRESGARTVAYVEGKAWSAGAYIALACDETFMAPGASIGAITPVLDGGMDIPEGDARSKLFAAIKGRVSGLLEARGGFSEDARRLAEGMVDRGVKLHRVTYQDASGIQKTAIRSGEELRRMELDGSLRILDQQAYSAPVVLTANEAMEPPVSLSRGIYSSLDELFRDELGLTPTSVQTLEPTWSERAADWIDGLRWLLFGLGFVLLLVELKSPGFAVPGALGILFLAVGMFGSYATGLAEWTEILLFFLGLIAVAVEIFVFPGTLVFGILGFLSVIAALLFSRQSFLLPSDDLEQDILFYNLIEITGMLLATMVLTALVWRLLPRLPVFNRILLAPPASSALPEGSSRRLGTGSNSAADSERLRKLLGQRGVAATMLRPTGIAEFAGDRVDVVSDGGFIDSGQPVRVVAIESYRVVVEPLGDDAAGATAGGATT